MKGKQPSRHRLRDRNQKAPCIRQYHVISAADHPLPIVSCAASHAFDTVRVQKGAPLTGRAPFLFQPRLLVCFCIALVKDRVRSIFLIAHRSPDRAHRGSPFMVALWRASFDLRRKMVLDLAKSPAQAAVDRIRRPAEKRFGCKGDHRWLKTQALRRPRLQKP